MISFYACARYKSLLVDTANDAVTGRRKQRIEAHLRHCAACRADLVSLRTLPAQLRSCDVPDLDESAWAAQRRAIADAIRKVPRPRPRLTWVPALAWQPTLAALASILLTIGVYRYSARPGFRSVQPTAVGDVLGLDEYTFNHLLEVMAVLTPADDSLLRPVVDNDSNDPPLSNLDDDELDGLADLVGVS